MRGPVSVCTPAFAFKSMDRGVGLTECWWHAEPMSIDLGTRPGVPFRARSSILGANHCRGSIMKRRVSDTAIPETRLVGAAGLKSNLSARGGARHYSDQCHNSSMLTSLPMMHADERPQSANAQANAGSQSALPPDMSEWRLDGRLSKLVAQRFDMDEEEALRFALACGSNLAVAAEPEPFDRHLRDMILRYGLVGLFQDNGHYPYHHAIKPAGYDYDADAVIPEAMAQWRATYRALPEAHQMIAATIIWLYRGGPDTVWLRRVAVAWPAADAIALLRATAGLPDWGLLVSLYPGW